MYGHPARHIFTDRRPVRLLLPMVFWTVFAVVLTAAAFFFCGEAFSAEPFPPPCTAGVTDGAVILIALICLAAGYLVGAVLTCRRNAPWL